MGHSLTVVEKPPLEFTLEISKDLRLEISTGFGSGSRPEISVSLPVTREELKQAIATLLKIDATLDDAWKCGDCGEINQGGEKLCSSCDSERRSEDAF